MSRPRLVLIGAAGTLAGLEERLEPVGIELVTYPLLAFDDPADWGPLDRALERLASYAALAVTSPRASAAFVRRLTERTVGAVSLPPVWVTGAATAAAFRVLGVRCEMADTRSRLDGAAAQLAAKMVRARVGSPVLFPCGDRHRPDLVDRLTRSGITVDKVICYRSHTPQPGRAADIVETADLLVVSSPSTVAALETVLGGSMPRIPVIAIGPTTLAEATRAGWPQVRAAREPTAAAVAECATEWISPPAQRSGP